MPFTAQELEEMQLADAEIEASFYITNAEIELSDYIDCVAKFLHHQSTKESRYYGRNKEKVAAAKRKYYHRNKETIKAKHKAQKAIYNDNHKKWQEKNVEAYADRQKIITFARESRKWSKQELANRVGVSQRAVAKWESGKLKANWTKLCAVMPELMEVI